MCSGCNHLSLRKILLIVSCGKKKAEELKIKKMKAEDAYRGPMFQVINKAKRENRWSSKLRLGIISAKYGFLRGDEEIEYYDKKMTKTLATQYQSKILEKIRNYNETESFSLIYVLMGRDYLLSVHGLENVVDTTVRIENMGGLGIGQRKLANFLVEVKSRKEESLNAF
ncbi:MAG: DUF6884 domain-containing protein [Candidatus Hodarchaeales archaeon]